jgi:hypothetical protein
MTLRPHPKKKKHADITTLNPLQEPKSFLQATKFKPWRDAMQKEIHALLRNQTWVLVPRPPNANIIQNNGYIASSTRQMEPLSATKRA